MSSYVVDPRLVSEIVTQNCDDGFLNILVPFFQDGRCYLFCVDKGGLYMNLIMNLAENTYTYGRLLLQYINDFPGKLNTIDIQVRNIAPEEVFCIKLAKETLDKKIVTHKEDSYSSCNNEINSNGINILDYPTAKNILTQQSIQTIQNITFGNNSPIVTGNNNKVQ